MPGLYWRFPVVWKISKSKVTQIPQGSIGIVESIDGKPLTEGQAPRRRRRVQLLPGRRGIPQERRQEGPQVAILVPGTYRINTAVFKVEHSPAIEVPKEMVGVVVAMDGTPLPSGYIVAPEPKGDHKHFQDGQAFISLRRLQGAPA